MSGCAPPVGWLARNTRRRSRIGQSQPDQARVRCQHLPQKPRKWGWAEPSTTTHTRLSTHFTCSPQNRSKTPSPFLPADSIPLSALPCPPGQARASLVSRYIAPSVPGSPPSLHPSVRACIENPRETTLTPVIPRPAQHIDTLTQRTHPHTLRPRHIATTQPDQRSRSPPRENPSGKTPAMDAAAELQSLRFSPRSSAWKHMQKFERLLANAYPHATDAGKWSVPQIPRFAVGLLPGRQEGGDRAKEGCSTEGRG